jgi:hypothetical protein
MRLELLSYLWTVLKLLLFFELLSFFNFFSVLGAKLDVGVVKLQLVALPKFLASLFG